LVRPFGGILANFYSVSLTCHPDCSQPFPAVEEASLTTTPLNRRVIASWSSVTGQIGCQTQVREANGSVLSSQTVLGENADSLVIPIALLELNTNYEWRVRCGCSQIPIVAGPWSSWQPFTAPIGFGISTNPNPTTGVSLVSFTAQTEAYATLEVFDLSGRLVESIFAGVVQPDADYRFEFDGSALPNGVYLYRLNTEEESVHQKFMIAR